ncbi:hypothetical protein [Mycobacterium marseillense]|uniref:hypothetical protein n=1 Tax=Mycobacterium marseillense TaxID=701042 RepID=UPI0011A5A34A|nr:hypothetical protein [Mycobacterium marseillense]
MSDIQTNWVDNAGMVEDAAYLNSIGAAINANTHARPTCGTFDDRPAADSVTAGALYFCLDNDTVYRSDGTDWIKVRVGADSCDAMGDVPATGWTAVNMQTGATWAQDKDDMLFTAPSVGSPGATGSLLQYQYRSYPSPPFSLTTYIDCAIVGNNTPTNLSGAVSGIVVSDGTKVIIFGPIIGYNTGIFAYPFWGADVSRYTTVNSTATTVKGWPSFSLGAQPKWYRVIDDGTDLQYQYSINGMYWTTLFSEPRSSFLTPSQIGVGADNYFGTSLTMGVRSWHGVA